jgi:hypothetical protein
MFQQENDLAGKILGIGKCFGGKMFWQENVLAGKCFSGKMF